MNGLLENTAGSFVLTQCGSDSAQPVIATAALSEAFTQATQPGQAAIFVDMRAQLDSQGRVTPIEVLRMQSHGNGCENRSDAGAEWVALQYQPAWRVTLNAKGLTRSDAEQSFAAQQVVTEHLPDGSLNARSLQGEGVELWLYPQVCQDVQTGDYFHMSATLLVDGERFTGCGYQGRQMTP